MILAHYRLIFLHLQKTGGNSVTELLLPFSDDQKTIKKHQDGKDRFGIRSDLTKRKHAVLADYQETLGQEFRQYRVAITVRDPFERAVSMYFSPHKWYVPKQGQWVKEAPYWDIDRFEALVLSMMTINDFLMIGGQAQQPDFCIQHASLKEDLDQMLIATGIPATASQLPHINQSAADSLLKTTALQDVRARRICDEVFRDDIALIQALQHDHHPASNVA